MKGIDFTDRAARLPSLTYSPSSICFFRRYRTVPSSNERPNSGRGAPQRCRDRTAACPNDSDGNLFGRALLLRLPRAVRSQDREPLRPHDRLHAGRPALRPEARPPASSRPPTVMGFAGLPGRGTEPRRSGARQRRAFRTGSQGNCRIGCRCCNTAESCRCSRQHRSSRRTRSRRRSPGRSGISCCRCCCRRR
jgi:hypothetical protein